MVFVVVHGIVTSASLPWTKSMSTNLRISSCVEYTFMDTSVSHPGDAVRYDCAPPPRALTLSKTFERRRVKAFAEEMAHKTDLQTNEVTGEGKVSAKYFMDQNRSVREINFSFGDHAEVEYSSTPRWAVLFCHPLSSGERLTAPRSTLIHLPRPRRDC